MLLTAAVPTFPLPRRPASQALVQKVQTAEYDAQRQADKARRAEEALGRLKGEASTGRDRERLLSTEITRLKTMLDTQRMQVRTRLLSKALAAARSSYGAGCCRRSQISQHVTQSWLSTAELRALMLCRVPRYHFNCLTARLGASGRAVVRAIPEQNARPLSIAPPLVHHCRTLLLKLQRAQ